MTSSRISLALWAAFGATSAATFAFGYDKTLNFAETYLIVGFINTILAGVLSWRHGVTLPTLIVLVAYAMANRWWFLLVFYTVIFSRGT